MPGYPDWQPNSVLTHDATPIAGDTFTFGAIPGTVTPPSMFIRQVSYELYVSAQNGLPAGTASYMTVLGTWQDSQTSLVLAFRRFKMVSGPNGTPHTLKIAGPVHGDKLTLAFGITADSVQPITVTWQVLGTSRQYSRDFSRSTLFAQDGFTSSGVLPSYGVLINRADNPGAGVTFTRLIGMYSGRVHVAMTTASGTNDLAVAFAEAAGANPELTGVQTVAVLNSDTKGNIDTFVELPNLQCVVKFTNNNAAAKVVNTLVAVEEPS
jgi:hypothetical protein